MADLTKELAKGPAQAAPKNDTPPAEDTPPPEQSQRSSAPTPEPGKPIMQGLMDSLKKGMDEKAAASDKTEKPEPTDDKTETPAKNDAKKPIVSTDDAPPKKKADPSAPPEELAPEERGVLPHDSERVRKRINYFLAEDKKNKEAVAKIQAELAEARKAPQTAANAEEVAKIKADLEAAKTEATRLRRRYDWDNDTEAKAKYREPIAVAEKAVEEALRKNKFGDAILNAIKEAGGFAAFSRSQATYPIEVIDPDTNEKKVVNYTAAELARSWVARLPIADAELIRQSVGRQELLQNEEKAAIAKAQEEAKGYYENQTKAQREAQAANEATLKKHAEEYSAWRAKTEGETEWLKDRPVPENATPDQAKQIEEFNLAQKELREGLEKHPTNALEYGQLKLDAAESRHLKRTMAEKDAEIERLTAELKRKSAAQKTTGKGGSLLVKDGHKPDEEKKPAGNTNFMDAINKTMKQKAGVLDDE